MNLTPLAIGQEVRLITSLRAPIGRSNLGKLRRSEIASSSLLAMTLVSVEWGTGPGN